MQITLLSQSATSALIPVSDWLPNVAAFHRLARQKPGLESETLIGVVSTTAAEGTGRTLLNEHPSSLCYRKAPC